MRVRGVSVNRPRPAVTRTGSGTIFGFGAIAAVVAGGAVAAGGRLDGAGRGAPVAQAETVSRHASAAATATAADRARDSRGYRRPGRAVARRTGTLVINANLPAL
jgi:hypothetical protein